MSQLRICYIVPDTQINDHTLYHDPMKDAP